MSDNAPWVALYELVLANHPPPGTRVPGEQPNPPPEAKDKAPE